MDHQIATPIPRPSRRTFLGGALGAGLVTSVGSPLLASCGGDSDIRSGGDDAVSELKMVGVLQPQPGRGFSKLLEDYEKDNDVHIDYQFFDSPKFVALFTAAEQADQDVDLVLLNGQDLRRYATSGGLMPLDDHVDYADRFWPLPVEAYTVDGKLWGVPTLPQGGFPITVNQQLLTDVGIDELPQAYADLKTAAGELAKNDVKAFTHPGKEIYLWPVWFFTTYAQATGNKSVERTKEILSTGGAFTDDDTVDGLDLIFQFARDGLFTDDVLSTDTEGAQAAFVRGKAAFWMGGPVDPIREAKPKTMDLHLSLMPRLVDDASVKSQFPGGPGAPLCIYKKIPDERVDAALEFIDFFSSDDSASYLTTDAKAALSVNRNGEVSDDPTAAELASFIEQMTVFLDWFWPPEVTSAFQEGIQAGVAQKKDAKSVAADIQAAWEKVQKSGFEFTA